MLLNDYRAEIDRMIIAGLDESISNGSTAHAAIIIERMFKHANSSMKILTRIFNPQIFGQPEVLQYADAFLADTTNHTCEVLVEEYDPDYNNTHPFVRMFSGRKNVKILQLPDGLGSVINSNFAVMDNRGVRMETERASPKALANFGDIKFAGRMTGFFDVLLPLGTQVTLDGAAAARETALAGGAGPMIKLPTDAPLTAG